MIFEGLFGINTATFILVQVLEYYSVPDRISGLIFIQ